MSKLGTLPDDTRATASFIELMDQLFNACNSRSCSNSKKFGHAISNDSGHKEFLLSVSETFAKLTTMEGKSFPYFTGWIITIQSMVSLWQDLNSDGHCDFLLTNRLNQDCVENLFSIIRGKRGHRDNPDPREFRGAFRQVEFDQLLASFKGSNCEEDLDEVLLSLSSIANVIDSERSIKVLHSQSAAAAQSQPQSVTRSSAAPDELVSLEHFRVMKPPPSLPEQNIVAYMSGYLLRKADISQCVDCSLQLVYDIPPHNELYTFLKYKAHEERGTLVYPTETFKAFIQRVEDLFSVVLSAVMHMEGVMRRLFKNVSKSLGKMLECNKEECSVKLRGMILLYLKVRLHHALRISNRQHKITGGKRNRKIMKLMHV